jgi:hypothetical protein
VGQRFRPASELPLGAERHVSYSSAGDLLAGNDIHQSGKQPFSRSAKNTSKYFCEEPSFLTAEPATAAESTAAKSTTAEPAIAPAKAAAGAKITPPV